MWHFDILSNNRIEQTNLRKFRFAAHACGLRIAAINRTSILIHRQLRYLYEIITSILPYGLKYRLYYGLADGTCIVRYDNESGKGGCCRKKIGWPLPDVCFGTPGRIRTCGLRIRRARV